MSRTMKMLVKKVIIALISRRQLEMGIDPTSGRKVGDLKNDLVEFTEKVLKNNNFEFNERHFVQRRGTAIGTRMAPSYGNIFMDKLERQLISHALIKPHTWWWYIDDIFIIWTEGEESLKDFLNYLNSAHGTIKFTSKWSYQEVEFLDVKVLNDSGKLETDVYIK